MHDKPGSASRVNICQQEGLLFPAIAADTHDGFILANYALASQTMLLCVARLGSPHNQHGRSKRSGWSDFGPTTFSPTKRAGAHFEYTK